MIEEFKDLTEVQLIIFSMGQEEYAIPITCIQEIIMPQQPTKIPKLPSFVEGIINLRGKIIPVVDGKKKFQIQSDTIFDQQERRIIVIDISSHTIGLIVDAVSEVKMQSTADVEPPPVSVEDTEAIWGVGKIDNRLIILLNPEKILDTKDTAALLKVQSLTGTVKAA